ERVEKGVRPPGRGKGQSSENGTDLWQSKGVRPPFSTRSEFALIHRKASLPPKMVLIKAEQVRHVGGHLSSKGRHIGVMKPERRVPHQIQSQGTELVALLGHEAEQTVDAFGLHPFSAEGPEPETGHG